MPVCWMVDDIDQMAWVARWARDQGWMWLVEKMLPNLVGWGLRVANAAQAVGLLVYPAGPVATVAPVVPVGPHFLELF